MSARRCKFPLKALHETKNPYSSTDENSLSMAPATTSRVGARPVLHPACQSFESIASDVSCSSSSFDCQSRDSSISSRTSANSGISSLTHIPPWEKKKLILHPQLGVSNYYDYDLPCEFEFLGCNLRFHPEYFEAWISHTASHFVRTSPPSCAICTFCDGERFEDYEDPVSNWRGE
jgi:hypothetical protein